MIDIQLSEDGKGHDIATAAWNGATYAATEAKADPGQAVARQLVRAGCPDGRWQQARGAKVCLRGWSLWELACRDTRDADRRLVDGVWQPHPLAGADALALYAKLAPVRERMAARHAIRA